MRPVAITGVGLLCAAGLDPVQARARLAQGPLIPQPPPDVGVLAPLLLPLAEGFDPRKVVTRRKDLKLMARANRLALGAARQALAQAGRAGHAEAGLFLAVGREPMSLRELLPVLHHSSEAGQVTLDRLIDEGMHWMHPLASLKTLPNMCVAHVAIELDLTGPTMALCDDADMGPRALTEAALAVSRGDAPWALAGGADARLAFGDRLSAETLGDGDRPLSEAAAVFVLEPLEDARARGARVIAVLGPREGCPPVAHDRLGDCGAATLAAA
ncbi:MAG: hypothetical protein KC613_13740, partial [Myxococcales bacterium]|nr:hypothetical protein [Myxococcales bacterium]